MAGERQLTELEGAILTEIAVRRNDTAYKVRKAFQDSPSVHWKGSAGAVSPAIRRLVAAGLIAETPHSSRRGSFISLTKAGEHALRAWASDVDSACGLGIDPFRLRAGLWDRLPASSRKDLYRRLDARLAELLDALLKRQSPDHIDERQTQLAIGLIQNRLDWLREAPAATRNPQEKLR